MAEQIADALTENRANLADWLVAELECDFVRVFCTTLAFLADGGGHLSGGEEEEERTSGWWAGESVDRDGRLPDLVLESGRLGRRRERSEAVFPPAPAPTSSHRLALDTAVICAVSAL